MLQDVKPHLVELRKRIFISVLALIVSFVLSFIFYKPILHWVTAPLESALVQANKIVKKNELGKWETSDINATTPASTPAAKQQLEQNSSMQLSIVDKAIKGANSVLTNPQSTSQEKALAQSLKDLANYTKKLAKESDNGVFWGSVTTNQIGGVFLVALKISLYASIFLSLPIILWQMWLFVAPGLYDNEKKMALPFLFGVTIMFTIGVLFAYYIVTPFGFQFLITFGAFLYTPLINIEDYIGFFAKILFGFGIAFELPMIVYFLALVGLVTDRTLIGFFRYAIVIIFVVAALLTPPDIITQLLMAAPLIILYGVSIIVARIINPYKEESEDDEEPQEPKTDAKELER